jgi:uncharacterized membrane protein
MLARRRHIAKTVTWRIIASLTTFLLTLLFFKEDPNATEKAVNVAVIEATLKMIFYYYHERIWYLSKINIRSNVRHIFKTITWRIIASLTTFVIAFLIFKNDEFAMQKASGVAVVESFLKMILYYLHERIWYRQNLDLESRKVSR